MASKNYGFCAFLAVPIMAMALMMALTAPGRAGDVGILHVGEATTLHIEGKGWALDKAASRKANLVSVKNTGARGGAQVFEVRGLKTGQVELVFRSGARTFLAHVDVLN